jgi:Tfp pilus assembly PilM family ATPase/Tfp pilus assembly protein PilN
MANLAIGLDLTAESIKVVELLKTSKGIILSRAFKASLAKDENPDAVISRLWKENGLKANSVVSCLPASSVFMRSVKILPASPKKLNTIIGYEAKQQIPFPLTEVEWDYQVTSTQEALIVAAKKDFVQERFWQLERSGLVCEILDVSSLALYNCLMFGWAGLSAQEAALALNIGATATEIILFKGQNLWTRNIPFGRDRLSSDAGSRINFAEELKHSIDYYLPQLGGSSELHRAALSGLDIPGLEDSLREKLNIAIERINPFSKIDASSLPEAPAEFAIAVGLALRKLTPCQIEINLSKELLKKRAIFRQRRLYKVGSLILALLLVAVASLPAGDAFKYKEDQLQGLDKLIQDSQFYSPRVNTLLEEAQAVRKKAVRLAKLASHRSLIGTKVLAEIVGNMSDDIWITEFSSSLPEELEKNATLTLKGKAFSYEKVNIFLSGFKDSDYFKGVKLISTSSQKEEIDGQEQEVVSFNLTTEVVLPDAD